MQEENSRGLCCPNLSILQGIKIERSARSQENVEEKISGTESQFKDDDGMVRSRGRSDAVSQKCGLWNHSK